jgi:microcystin-dependent protein
MVSKNYCILLVLIIVSITIIYLYLNKENFQDLPIRVELSTADKGDVGDTGEIGSIGSQGPTGPTGHPGKSAYNMVIEEDGLLDDLELGGGNNSSLPSASEIVNKIVEQVKQEVINEIQDLDASSDDFDPLIRKLTDMIIENQPTVQVNTNENTNNITTQAVEINNPMLNMVVPYCGCKAPKGWQVCDGQLLTYYDPDNPNSAERVVLNGTTEVRTPNLIGRFVLGSTSSTLQRNTIAESDGLSADNVAKGTLSRVEGDYRVGQTSITSDGNTISGSTFVRLNVSHLPPHTHHYHKSNAAEFSGYSLGIKSGDMYHGIHDSVSIDAEPQGGGGKHNNMPPFIIMMYIIKRPLAGSVLREGDFIINEP